MLEYISLNVSLAGLILMGYLFILGGKVDLKDIASNVGFIENEKKITMVAVGDIMLSRSVEGRMKEKNNFKYPFLKTAQFISGADIAFGNLETPIISGKAVEASQMVFRADPKSVTGLLFAGFDMLSLSNNHIMNHGKKGLEETLKNLDRGGISYVGAGIGNDEISRSANLTVKGVKFSFLAYTYNNDVRKDSKGEIYGVSKMDAEGMKKDVGRAKENSDVVIVSMHAGTEYLTKSKQFQKDFARAAIDAGADLVIGHHPHVVQETEKYKDKYIIYSLGNFVFDQMWSNETRLGAVAEIIFQGKEFKNIRYYPVKIFDYSQPVFIEGKEAERIMDRLKVTQ